MRKRLVGQVGRVSQVGRVLIVLAFAGAGLGQREILAQSSAQPPRFQSSVEVTSLDVSVVDDKGKPITDLTPADFTVRIDGNRRKVTTAEWVPLDDKGAPAAAVPAAPDGYTTNEGSTNGRLIVIAVDQPNIRFGGAAGDRHRGKRLHRSASRLRSRRGRRIRRRRAGDGVYGGSSTGQAGDCPDGRAEDTARSR